MMGVNYVTDIDQSFELLIGLGLLKKLTMEYKFYILEILVRTFTGVIFLFQGYDKLFNLKIKGVAETFYLEAQKEHVPRPFVTLIAGFTSATEFFGGLLLILGLFKTVVLALLGLDIVLVAIAFSFVEPVWNMRHVFPRLVLIAALLAFPSEWEAYSLDRLIAHLL
ncbi:MAG: DoxX family protein [Bacteroidetes bacterium]|jgi:putative oxidoreductase|nr:DoxX family protein [Bacteroidota bacterium]